MSQETAEGVRLRADNDRKAYWKHWGPYLSERQWSTVREDYSPNGDAWTHFPHSQARSRTFRWGEDGIAGVSDTHALQCISFAFWNERDEFLKERLFGLAGPEGNHGEDVKEEYFYLDSTPTHSYMNYQYKYPQREFPYQDLVDGNAARNRLEQEYELVDTGIFEENRYFDIFIETAKDAADPELLFFKVTAYNRGPEVAPLHIIPQIVFRNTWTWDGELNEGEKPWLKQTGEDSILTHHERIGDRHIRFASREKDGKFKLLFTENETNKVKLWGESEKNATKHVKDAFHEVICDNNTAASNPDNSGTKACGWFRFDAVEPGEHRTVYMVQNKLEVDDGLVDVDYIDQVIEQRLDEADDFYYHISPIPLKDELRNIQRQAFAGMMWCKQYYQFIWDEWEHGDKAGMPPPLDRRGLRNADWKHLHIDDILSMPDKWEYPFFAAWDTAFHCIPLAMVDAQFAKKQLDLMTREWYMHPNGQLPAYEWNFSDVNPPVHAWATFRVFKLERRMTGKADIDFLERVFQKLLLNFTWWVNRKDAEGRNVFQGGFLGLDNIGLFNRSEPLPTGGVLEQADGTGWMGFYCLQMLNIALELSKTRRVYEDIASKFFEHFIYIADALSYKDADGNDSSLWDEESGFFFDQIRFSDGSSQKLPVRSLVGLIPLYASLTLDGEVLKRHPQFARRVQWFVEKRPVLSGRVMSSHNYEGDKFRILLSLVNQNRLTRILSRMLDEEEFLSDYGIRSMSKFHQENPFSMEVNGEKFEVDYQPGDSKSAMFGGNSNWRGPVWFPTTFLLIESLQRFFLFYGKDYKVKCPARDGHEMNLLKVAEEIQRRLINLFTRDGYKENRRPYNGGVDLFDFDENFDDGILFHEFFNPDTGRGLGSKHQCGWTGLVAKLIHDTGALMIDRKAFTEDPNKVSEGLFDDVFEPQNKKDHWRSKHHSRAHSRAHSQPPSNGSSRRNSTSSIIRNIPELIAKYSMDSGELDDLEAQHGSDKE